MHNRDVIMNSELITKFDYKVFMYIPKTYLNVLVYTEGVNADIIFFLRLYKTIVEIPEFIDIGEVKVVIICTHGTDVFTLGKGFPVTPKTTPLDFIQHFFKSFVRLSVRGYFVDSFDILFVKTVTGAKGGNTIPKIFKESRRSYSTSSRSISVSDPSLENLEDFVADHKKDPRRYILPLKTKSKQMKKFGVFDIETFVMGNKLYPYAIGLQYIKYNKVRKILFYYENNHESIEHNCEELIEKMVDYISTHCNGYTIFAHNLGKFDGIFMIPSLFKIIGPFKILIGKDGKIISMSFKNVKFLDSLRIISMSLRDLAKQFEVETQKGEFDYTKVNKDNVTNEEIKSELLAYLEKDISALHECMVKASATIFEKYKINLTDVYSASSLAMKVYRTSYLSNNGIPLLPRHLIPIISTAYYGGISQVYKTYGKNLNYYDVNSLYPWAMTQAMPYEYLGIAYKPKLKDTFGFVYASIYVPRDLEYKVLPVRINDSLATPSGNILGLYFSEELKYAEKLGCHITPHSAYQFSRKHLFIEYVSDFYKEKATAKGANRVFVKLLLNGLYGFFARMDEKHVALCLPLDEAIKQAQIYPTYNLIVMDDKENAILIRDTQPSKDLAESCGHNYLEYIDPNNQDRTKSNRAIAAAITAYSRIKTHEYKMLSKDVYYSDTDSIVTGNVLDSEYISDGLGFMKEEYSDIEEALFISPKLYGLKLKDGSEIIKNRGVKRGGMNMDDLRVIYNGGSIKIKNPKQLFRSLDTLSIIEKDITKIIGQTIPDGKVPIYGIGDSNNKVIVGYNDIHNSVTSAIKNNPVALVLRSRVRKIIDNYKDLVSSFTKDE